RQGNYYWSNWSEGQGNWNCRNEAGGRFSVTWSGNNGGFVCGKGWRGGSGNRVIRFQGSYTPTGPGYLAIYGWTRNPLIEYYIVESYDILAPGEPWTLKGNFSSDEGDYDIYTSTRVNKPSIEGTRTFQQFWSVRQQKRVGGTVSLARHFEEWSRRGMRLGGHDYCIVAVEGFTNGTRTPSGQASI
ncbi:glycoside hydrolase family 11 protein, partial [Sporormia fimetaria CBS 119925]